MDKKTARLITLEGIEGAGKSSIVPNIIHYLNSCGIPSISTKEPGGTEIAESIRQVILSRYHEKMLPYTELFLYFASRAQHVENVIKPALKSQKWIICDRFIDSSYAYQGIGRGIPFDKIATLENWVLGTLQPDLTLIFDLSPNISFIRKSMRDKDRIEDEMLQQNLYPKIREYYLNCSSKSPELYRIINANNPRDIVINDVIQCLQKLM